MQVSARNTPSTPAAVAGGLIWAYQKITGHAPSSRNSWLFPLAQAAVETAHFSGGLWRYNVGNITHVANDGHDWQKLPGNALQFRAYDSLGAGCKDMLRWLQTRGCLAYADQGNLQSYVNQLQNSCYLGCLCSQNNNAPGCASANDYPNYQSGMQGYISQYSSLVPIPYVPGINIDGVHLAKRDLATGVAIVVGSGLVAWYITQAAPELGRQLKTTLRALV